MYILPVLNVHFQKLELIVRVKNHGPFAWGKDPANVVYNAVVTMIDRGVLGTDILSSLISVVAGYVLGFVIALPVAILMAWYKPVRYIIEPWIQFIRNIPPLAYAPSSKFCTTKGNLSF